MKRQNSPIRRRITRRRGATAVLAMLFLVMFVTLSLAMLSLATSNAQSASSLSDVARAQDSAESGLRWMEYRFMKMDRPKTTIGNITASVAKTLWTNNAGGLQKAIADDFALGTVNGHSNPNQLFNAAERPWTVVNGKD